MAKITRRRKQPNSTIEGSRSHYQGLGYHIPAGYTLEQVRELFSKWNDKLQKSGHKDIEAFSDVLPGLSSAFLQGTKSYKAFSSHNDPSATFQFIQTYINYFMHTRQAKQVYGARLAEAQFLLNCYLEQVEYRDIAALAVSGSRAKFSKLYPSVEFPSHFKPLDMPKSHYWAYNRIRKLLNHCWLWHVTDQNGELQPKDLELYEFVGLDVKGTEERFNKVLAKLNKPLIKLKHKEAKY